jgi:hypothetical protein
MYFDVARYWCVQSMSVRDANASSGAAAVLRTYTVNGVPVAKFSSLSLKKVFTYELSGTNHSSLKSYMRGVTWRGV